MSRKNKKDDGLDTETTIVDMNVEGFKWYESEEKKKKRELARKYTKAERKSIMRSSFVSLALPVICLIVGGIIAYLLLYYVWLG